jgi:hypothetical protein
MQDQKEKWISFTDPNCTPGAISETLTLEVMTMKNFGTVCVRDQATSAGKKQATYTWYKIASPANDTGKNQVCELDHLVSLELGGADTLETTSGRSADPQRLY